MGKSISKLGGTPQKAQLDSWKSGKDVTLNMAINQAEVKT